MTQISKKKKRAKALSQGGAAMRIETPKPAGEYAVGTFTYTVADDREEVLRPSAMRMEAVARVFSNRPF